MNLMVPPKVVARLHDFVLESRNVLCCQGEELIQPSDMSPAQMKEAYREKIQKYAPIPLALQHYIHAVWSIEILPWVVDIREFADLKHLHIALEYLAIPKSQWKVIIEDSVLASVRALAYMHKIRYSGAGTCIRYDTQVIASQPWT